ncbi:DnaB-like helicase C-terminal domain-containing protein [Xanthobacter flavus]|uniref:replicative DNA helicase n=1 Tax=Xanthobacter flavus TaxID=281 RepID=UPI00372BC03F
MHTPISSASPICNVDVEQALLGALLVYGRPAYSAASGIVAAEQFYEPIHARIFELASADFLDGRTPTAPSLKGRLPADLDIAGLSPIVYLGRLVSEAAPMVSVADYARTIRELWAARQVAEIGAAVGEEVAQPDANVKATIAAALSDLDRIRAELDDKGRGRQSIANVLSGVLQRVDDIRLGRMESGATTGLADLDRMIGGLQGGRLIVAAGRPGTGKTALACSVSRLAAMAGCGVLFFSMEMPADELGARLLSDHLFRGGASPITSKMIFEGRLDSRQMAEVEKGAQAEILGLPLQVDDSSGLTVGEILARTRAAADEMRAKGQRLRVVVIDYLKFIKASERYRGQRVYEIAEITAGLKALAKDLDLCVVLLAQLNREVEKREDKRPVLSDLRESGDIEADADAVLLLYRESYYLRDKIDPESQARLLDCENRLEIIIAKCRMGSVGVVEVFYHPAANAVRNLNDRDCGR